MKETWDNGKSRRRMQDTVRRWGAVLRRCRRIQPTRVGPEPQRPVRCGRPSGRQRSGAGGRAVGRRRCTADDPHRRRRLVAIRFVAGCLGRHERAQAEGFVVHVARLGVHHGGRGDQLRLVTGVQGPERSDAYEQCHQCCGEQLNGGQLSGASVNERSQGGRAMRYGNGRPALRCHSGCRLGWYGIPGRSSSAA